VLAFGEQFAGRGCEQQFGAGAFAVGRECDSTTTQLVLGRTQECDA
jgi:hypothetical protein